MDAVLIAAAGEETRVGRVLHRRDLLLRGLEGRQDLVAVERVEDGHRAMQEGHGDVEAVARAAHPQRRRGHGPGRVPQRARDLRPP